MKRRQADAAVAILLGVVLLIGVVSTVQLLLTDEPVMGSAGSAPTIHFVGPVLVSVVVASILGGVYVVVRSRPFGIDADARFDDDRTDVETDSSGRRTGSISEATTSNEAEVGLTNGERRVLNVLPDDERRILEPVIESPGITQTAVGDRSGYSRSKVSQTITDLDERGLLYRERQGNVTVT